MVTFSKLHGIPKIIVSDIDLTLKCKFWTKLFHCFGTQ